MSATALKERLRADLKVALQARATDEVRLLRTLIAALDDAEAVPGEYSAVRAHSATRRAKGRGASSTRTRSRRCWPPRSNRARGLRWTTNGTAEATRRSGCAARSR